MSEGVMGSESADLGAGVMIDRRPGWLTRKGAKDWSGLSLRRVDELIAEGVLTSCKDGKRRLIKLASLANYLEGLVENQEPGNEKPD